MVPLIDALPQAWAVGAPSLEPTDEDVHAHLEAAARSVLDAAVGDARAQAPELEIVGELVEGRPTAVLLEAARNADLLVVGSRGHGGFAALLLGSISSQCVHHAPCPVVVVPPRQAAA
jgi:nucleotide-binding universal stress UspA family protein